MLVTEAAAERELMSPNSKATDALRGNHRLCDMSSSCRERKKASCDGAMSLII